MKRDEVLREIVQETRRIACHLPETMWYGFGSFFNGQTTFNDIDVLVVCPTTTDAILVRRIMTEICARWPLHLLVMTEDEEAETNFVASQRCVLLLSCQNV